MNTERILQLADYIESLPEEKFDMSKWCGTACCIAGHALRLFKMRAKTKDDIETMAAKALGLSPDEAFELFLARWRDFDKYLLIWDVPKSEAVAHLRSLAKGEQ